MRRRGRDSGKRVDRAARAMDRMMDRGDNIGALCLAVRSAGLTMRFNGQPVGGADDLRDIAKHSLMERFSR